MAVQYRALMYGATVNDPESSPLYRIIIIFIRHNMTGQQGTKCTKSSPTMCNKIEDITTIIHYSIWSICVFVSK